MLAGLGGGAECKSAVPTRSTVAGGPRLPNLTEAWAIVAARMLLARGQATPQNADSARLGLNHGLL